MNEEFDKNACENYDPLYPCKDDWIHRLSVANYGLTFDTRTVVGSRDQITNCLFIVLMYLLLAVFKNRLSNEHKVIDIETDTAADFSIMVTYLPKTATESDIKTFFETEFQGTEISEISLAYDVEELIKLEMQKETLHQKLINMVNFTHQNLTAGITIKQLNVEKDQVHDELPSTPMPEPTERSDQAYVKLKDELVSLQKEVAQHRREILLNHSKFFTGIAFITFQKMAHADQVTSKYKMSTLAWFFHGCKYKLRYNLPHCKDRPIIRIDPAPEPAEIQWQNLKYSYNHQVKQRWLNILIAAVILSMSLGIIFGLKYAAYKIKKNFQKIETVSKGDGSTYQKAKPLDTGEDALLQFISIMIFTVSKIVNKIFDKVLAKLAVWEKPYTNSSLYWSTMSKTVISQFLNASCLIVIVHYVLKGAERYIIWGSGSLLVDIWYLIIFYSMVNPGLYILNFGFFVNQCKKCKLKKYKDSKRYTQLQAHKISEGVPMDAVRCYTDIYQIFLTALFFAPAFPIGVVFMVGALIVIYWTNKFYLLRVYSRPKYLQSNLAFESLVFIKVGAFVLSMGELYFDIVLRGASNASIILIVQAVVTGLLIPVPIEDMFLDFYTYSGDEAEIKADVTYEKCKKTLDLNYLRANPITSSEALVKHIQLVKNIQGPRKSLVQIMKSSLLLSNRSNPTARETVPKINILPPESPTVIQLKKVLGPSHSETDNCEPYLNTKTEAEVGPFASESKKKLIHKIDQKEIAKPTEPLHVTIAKPKPKKLPGKVVPAKKKPAK